MTFFVLLMPAHRAEAKQAATIQSSLEDGFARIVVTFSDNMPRYNLRVTPSVIVVALGDPVDANADRVAQQLPGYIGVARVDPDGGNIRFALDQMVSVNTIEAGDQLFIDLLPRGWVGLPPSLPQEVIDALAERAKDEEIKRQEALRAEELRTSPQIDVRVARTPTFTRLSFGWHRPTEAALTRDGDKVYVQFNHAAPVDLSGLQTLLPDDVGDLASDVNYKGLGVSMSVKPTADVRAFHDGLTYMVDIAPEGANASETSPLLVAPAADPDVLRIDGVDPAELANADAAQENVTLVDTALPALERKADRQEAKPTKVSLPGEPPVIETAANPFNEARRIQPMIRRIGETFRIEVPFETPTPAAIFRRGKYLWMVFETPLPIDTRVLRNELGNYADDVSVSRAGSSQVVRMRLLQNVLSSSAIEDTNWIITIGDLVVNPARPITLARGKSFDGEPAVATPYEGGGSVHDFVDPVIGDRIFVATALGPPRAVLSDQDFADFVALGTRHGVAVVAKVDDLQVKLSDDVLSIEREHGLHLSAVGSFVPGGDNGGSGSIGRPGFVYADIEPSENPGLARERNLEWIRHISLADDVELPPARIAYSEFLLSQKLAPEAYSVLKMLGQETPETERDPAYRALLGIALVQMHRPAEALKVFDFYGLSNADDVSLWSGLALSQLGRWRDAQLKFEAGLPALGDYPPEDQRDFLLATARAAIEINDHGAANDIFGRLESDRGILNDLDYKYLRARMNESFGDKEQAHQLYSAVAESSNRQLAAEAELRRLQMLGRAKAIDPNEMIRRLQTLSITWRGDNVELETLRTLANFYVAQREYRLAFETMKAAAIAGPGKSSARKLQDEMQDVFVDLFLGGNVDGMSPVDALALYYDFKELTPVGRKGDEVIRALANRLIAVDLLAKAAEVLEHQVNNRLRGAARAQVAAKLALVYLMDRKPGKALRTLALSRQSVLPEEVKRQRSLLEARALTETGRSDLAIDLLRSVKGPEVDRMLADTYWAARDWQAAGETLEGIVGDAWREDRSLTPLNRRDILRAAIAFTLADNELGMDRLRDHFAAKMANTDDEKAFAVVTDRVERRGSEFRAIAASLAQSESLDAFVREYREKYDRQAVMPQS